MDLVTDRVATDATEHLTIPLNKLPWTRTLGQCLNNYPCSLMMSHAMDTSILKKEPSI